MDTTGGPHVEIGQPEVVRFGVVDCEVAKQVDWITRVHRQVIGNQGESLVQLTLLDQPIELALFPLLDAESDRHGSTMTSGQCDYPAHFSRRNGK